MGYKEEQIKKAIERREASIKRFQDLKSVSIAVSSAFNSASELCNILVGTGRIKVDKDMDEYWKMHEDLYAQFLDRFGDAQDGSAREFMRAQAAKTAHAIYKKDKVEEAKELFQRDQAPE